MKGWWMLTRAAARAVPAHAQPKHTLKFNHGKK
jgi:hypothetical protein